MLIVERPDDEYVNALKPGSPEHRLLNYVLLQYPNAKAADTARESFTAQRLFRSVQVDISGEFSAAPNDPYFAPSQSSPLNKQWGMSALNLPAAWDIQNGFAYIGVVDNGIQRYHPDLGNDRSGNARAHFSGAGYFRHPHFRPRLLPLNLARTTSQLRSTALWLQAMGLTLLASSQRQQTMPRAYRVPVKTAR